MRVLITGAAGFIGGEAARILRQAGHEIIGLDVREGPRVDVIGDIRSLTRAGQPDGMPRHVDAVIHCAAQTAVTRSYEDPAADLSINALGTMRVCMWARAHGCRAFIHASTNKVFGPRAGARRAFDGAAMDPATPYGISKAAAALYVREWFPDRSWILHQSCVYGPGQAGTEDQGWVDHVVRCAVAGTPITCFGDGAQIRDLLHVRDLVRLYRMILEGRIGAGIYVVGGGPSNAVTFRGLVDHVGGRIGRVEDWRPHDQRYFVANTWRLERQGWRPRIGWREGVDALRSLRAREHEQRTCGESA